MSVLTLTWMDTCTISPSAPITTRTWNSIGWLTRKSSLSPLWRQETSFNTWRNTTRKHTKNWRARSKPKNSSQLWILFTRMQLKNKISWNLLYPASRCFLFLTISSSWNQHKTWTPHLRTLVIWNWYSR